MDNINSCITSNSLNMKSLENQDIDKTGIYSNDSGTVKNYFQFYSKLMNQQNMLQDYVRTTAYYNSIQNNIEDFANKKVLDLGTGSGILAIFSTLAGAKKVFAIEGSDSVHYAKKLIKFHNLESKIELINMRIEDIPENYLSKVDTLISEPLGVLLVNERMLESYLKARDKFLVKGGKMFPSSSTMFFIPFCDESLYKEQINKVSFWDNENFYGLNMYCLKEEALKEKFRQPIVDIHDPTIHVCNVPCKKIFDFYTLKCEDLLNFTIKLEFTIPKATLIHGIACWFDTFFSGTNKEVVLSTSPYESPTHWYQVRLLLPEPLAVNKNEKLIGEVKFEANTLQSYYIHLKVGISRSNIWIENTYDLKDPEFRGYTGYNNRSNQS